MITDYDVIVNNALKGKRMFIHTNSFNNKVQLNFNKIIFND